MLKSTNQIRMDRIKPRQADEDFHSKATLFNRQRVEAHPSCALQLFVSTLALQEIITVCNVAKPLVLS